MALVALLAALLVLGLSSTAAASEVFVTDQLTDGGFEGLQPEISGDRVVWTGYDGSAFDIFTWTSGGGTVRLSNDGYSFRPRVSGDRVAWAGFAGTSYEVFTWTPVGGIVQITNDAYTDQQIEVSGDRVVWMKEYPTGYEIFTWTPDGGAVQLTNNGCDDYDPQVSGDRVVWYGMGGTGTDTDYEIWTWTPGGGVAQITTNEWEEDYHPQVCGDRVVWYGTGGGGSDGDYEIWTWTPTGGIVQISSHPLDDKNPQLSGDRVVWQGQGGSLGDPDDTDYEIWSWTPSEGRVQVTINGQHDAYPQVSGDRVVWEGSDGSDTEIFTWTPGGGVSQISLNPFGDSAPQVSGDRVVWQGDDGSDDQVYTAVPIFVITQITDDSYEDHSPEVSGDRVAWHFDDGDFEIATWTPSAGTLQLTHNGSWDYVANVSGERMVWWGQQGADYDVFTWTPAGGVVQLTTDDNGDDANNVKVSGDRVVWEGYESYGSDIEIFTWTPSEGIVQVTSNSYSDFYPELSGDRVVWERNDGADWEIFTWTPGGGEVRLTNNSYVDSTPQVSADRVVWCGSDGSDMEIFTWTPGGGVVQLTSNSYADSNPQVSGDRVVWSGYDGSDTEVFTWTPGGGTVQLTDNGTLDSSAEVSGDRVAWMGDDGSDYEVFTWTLGDGTVKLTANDYEDLLPRVSGSRIVWKGYEDIYGEIFTAIPPAPVVTRVDPTYGPSAGGTEVTVTGTNFVNVTGVTFGGTAAADYTVDSLTQITATSPVHAAGTVQVQVTAAGGASVDNDMFDDFLFLASILYQQNNAKLTYLGPWSTASDASASGGSFSWTSSSGAAAIASFTGTSVTLLAKTGPNRGLATVSLDGGEYEAVDFYTSTYLPQQVVYEKAGLANEAHTLAIRCDRHKDPASTDYLIVLDALRIVGTLTQADPLTLCEQNDDLLSYAGTWYTATDAAASGGSFSWTDSSGGAVNIQFHGNYLGLLAKTGPTRGMALVTLEGFPPEEVDLYSPTYVDQKLVYHTGFLSTSAHTFELTISWAGDKNPAATGYLVDLDAVEVLGDFLDAPPPPALLPTRYQESDPKITYLGPWTTAADASASGGSFRWTSSAGAAATATFTGTEVALLAKTGPARGIALVSVDGKPAEEVDLYSPTYLQRQVVYEKQGLANEAHTLSIEWSGLKNPSATAYTIVLDALQIVGSLTQAPPTTRYEEDDGSLVYAGDWYTATSSSASGGSFGWAGASGAALSVEFEGTHLSLVSKTGPTRGIALLSLDGGAYQEVDLYSSSYLEQQSVYNTGLLADGVHTLIICWSGDKNPAATGTLVVVDALDVLGELAAADPPPALLPNRYQESDPKLTYLGPWKTSADAAASGGSFSWTNSSGAAATATFTGTEVALLAKTGPARGIALVRVDGKPAEEVDLYSPTYLQRQVVYQKQGLANEAHTLSIEWSGLKNPSATAYTIVLDALQIVGSLTQAPPTTRYEEDDGRLVYAGDWYTATDASASGGSFRWASSSGAVLGLQFEGTHLSLLSKTGPTRGIALLSLDGKPAEEVDLYSSTYLSQQLIYSTGLLGTGVHTLTITWSGEKNPAATGYLIVVDALDVLGELVD